MFCWVCSSRVRVWGSYRISRTFGYGCGSVSELPEVPGIVAQAYRTSRSSGRVQKHAVPVPRVLWPKTYRTSRSFRYEYECRTELSEVSGTGMKKTSRTSGYFGTGVQNFQKFRAGINMLYPYPGSLWHRRKELPEVPGTGMSVLHNLQKFL